MFRFRIFGYRQRQTSLMAKSSLGARAKDNLTIILAFLGPMLAFHWIYGKYFPNPWGRIGGDYTYFLPHLLDGHIWWQINGPWQVPWFTPSFCGGIPAFGNPQNMYYSVPQLLMNLTGPLNSIYFTFILFSAVGFVGSYLLLKEAFGFGRALSWLGAVLFLFNGFYAHRILIGHFAYHAYPLMPLACYFLLRPLPEQGLVRIRRFILDSVVAALAFTAMIYSGMLVLGLPVGASIMLIGAIYAIFKGKSKEFWGRFALAGLFALILGASRFSAILALMEQFPRSQYPFVGGIENPPKLLYFIVQILFFWQDRTLLTNWPYVNRFGPNQVFDVHDYEYSVTVAPLIIMIPAAYLLLRKAIGKGKPDLPSFPLMANLVLAALLILFPLALNYSFSNPWFEETVKRIPVLNAYSKYMIWFSVLIPAAIIIPLGMLDALRPGGNVRRGIAVAGVVLAVLQMYSYNRIHYVTFFAYDHHVVEEAYRKMHESEWIPKVERLADQSGLDRTRAFNHMIIIGSEDFLTQNASQMLCYEPLFGYILEKLPLGAIRPGPVMEARDGFFNLKNPACYAYPSENVCRPGDHFRVDQQEMAERFRSYKPIDFQMPLRQKVANWISLAGLVTTILFLFYYINNLIFPIKGSRKHEGGESS